jgi:predicted DNA-binding transcriptional regulator AlpA
MRDDLTLEALLDVNDVAHLLKVSRSWVYHAAESGRLQCVRIDNRLLRFEPAKIRALMTTSFAPARLVNP